MSGEMKPATTLKEQPQAEEPTPPVEEEVPASEIAPVIRKQPKPLSQRDPGQLARAFAQSGYWKHVRSPAQAVVVMAAGEELGLTPLASMQGITIIEGKIGYTGNLIATLLQQHERYGYKIIERNNERCTLQFLLDGEPIADEEEGKVTFSVGDAERAELVKPRSNWVKYPRAMCFNRALTEGVRAYFPDLTSGSPVYSTEEIEEVVHVEAQDVEIHDSQPTGAETPQLDPGRVTHLVEGIELVKPQLAEMGAGGSWVDGLNIILGSIGIGLVEVGQVEEGIAAFTDEQADKFDAELQKMADGVEPEEVDAEVVQGGGEAHVG